MRDLASGLLHRGSCMRDLVQRHLLSSTFGRPFGHARKTSEVSPWPRTRHRVCYELRAPSGGPVAHSWPANPWVPVSGPVSAIARTGPIPVPVSTGRWRDRKTPNAPHHIQASPESPCPLSGHDRPAKSLWPRLQPLQMSCHGSPQVTSLWHE